MFDSYFFYGRIAADEYWAPSAEMPGALSSFRQRGLFNCRSDFVRMNDKRRVAASDLRYLGLNPGREKLLGFGRDYLVFRADHIKRRFIVPRRGIDWGLKRYMVQWGLRVCQGFGDLRRKISRDCSRKHFRIDVEIALCVRMNRRGPFGRGAAFGQGRQRFAHVGCKRGNVDKRRDLWIVTCFCDDHSGPGVADENGPAILLRERLFGGINIRGEGGKRVFDERYVVALLREDIGNGLPARLVHESAVYKNDIVGRALRQLSRLGGSCNSSNKDAGR
jgi:hypothetical protein